MKAAALILGSCAFLALPMGSAGAGQCTTEIENLSKVLIAQDAGMGPTPGAGNSRMGQHPPTAIMSQADQSGSASMAARESGKPQHPPTEIMNRETTGSSRETTGSSSSGAPAGTKEEHPPTAIMSRETQGRASSPEDVQRQNQGQPTASEQTRGPISESHSMAGAMSALERARFFDQQGKESECLSAIGMAKLISGWR